MSKLLITNLILIIQILLIVFILPLNTKSFNDTYLQQLSFFYGSINYLKIPIITSFVFVINLIMIFINYKINNITNITSNKTRINNTIYIVFFLFLSLSLFVILPSHCPLKTCFYKNPKNINLNNNKYVNFFGLGDIQNLHHVIQSKNETDNKWHNRIYATELYIESINKFIEKIKNNDTSNMNIALNEEDKKLFYDIIKENIQGVINVGDCTQTGDNNGGLIGKNGIGAYEYAFNNNPEDNGLLKIPSFEVLGNHDYDSENLSFKKEGLLGFIKKFLLFEGNPMINMQLRRNKKRRFLVDKDNYGNYALQMDELHLIFINNWASKEKLLNGDSTGSIEFLENYLKQNSSKKWLLVTHYMPRVKKSFDEIIENESGSKRYLKDFGNIYEKYKDNCLGVIYGHVHTNVMNHFKNNGLQHYNVPGPASYLSTTVETRESINMKNIEIPLFSYVKSTKKLEKFKINIKKINNNLIFNISSYLNLNLR